MQTSIKNRPTGSGIILGQFHPREFVRCFNIPLITPHVFYKNLIVFVVGLDIFSGEPLRVSGRFLKLSDAHMYTHTPEVISEITLHGRDPQFLTGRSFLVAGDGPSPVDSWPG